MNKKRIFIANDASFLDTGYGVYGKEIISRLHNSDKFEVAELGCYADINNSNIKNIPWKFYPNAVNNNDKRFNQYNSHTLNQFGFWRFDRCLIDFKPHIVFDVRDYWMYSYQETSPLKKYFHWVIMPTTDSAPPKIEWLFTFANADVVVPYTDWAKKVLLEYCGSQINLFPKIANAGINPSEFYPLENKKELQEKYFGRPVSVTGIVMRNQKRKLFPDIFLAYKKYLEALKLSGNNELYEQSILYLHTSYPEENGWDFPSLLLEYGLLDKTYFSYVCRQCKDFFPSKFQSSVNVCPNCKTRSATVAGPSFGIRTHQLNIVYNLFDFFVQYAICEGFGMPQVEAAACGLKIASVDYSAMTEIVENLNGIKIPIQRKFREMETNADRVYPDIDATAQTLYDFFVNTSDETKVKDSVDIRNKCLEKYTWDNVYKVWEQCFDSIDIKKKISWDSPDLNPANPTLTVPNNLNNQEFITFICTKIINSPELMNTSFLQSLFRDANYGFVPRNKTLTLFTRQNIVDSLQGFLNSKIIYEQMRTNPSSLTNEDFLNHE